MKPNVFILFVCVAITVAGTLFFIRNVTHKQEPGYPEQIRDSIQISEQRRQLHQDSAKYWNEQNKIFTAKSDSVSRLDSIGRAALREYYRAGLREQIRAELTR